MTKRWTYGVDGERYPVQPGDVWTCAGHTFRCGSMMDDSVAELARWASMIYCDPPWNASNLSSFYTKAGRPKPEFNWLDIYQRVLELADGKPCFFEGGVHQERELAELVRQPYYHAWRITYYRKIECTLHYCGSEPCDLNLTGYDDVVTPILVMQHYDTSRVLDPCAGMGTTSRCADQAGWFSLNNELNPNRMSVALSKLARQTGLQPTRREALADAR